MIEAFRQINLIEFLIRIDVYGRVIGFLGEIFALIVLVGIIVVVGSLGQHRYGERFIGYIDLAISAIPGIGTVYKSFRRMGDVMLDDTSENFEEVRLVRCLGENIYMLGFETGQSPKAAATATGHGDMVTMFLPLAPNPVTGGYLTYVPRSRVYDVDMTIEEGIRSILTSGVAADDQAGMIPDDHAFSDIESLQDVVPGTEPRVTEPDDGHEQVEAGPDDDSHERR